MRAGEWRLLPVLRRLPDTQGRDAFILLHVPLIAAIIWVAANPSADVRFWFQAAADAFLVIHVVLHRAFERHPGYDFHAALSRALILDAGAVGALHASLLAWAASVVIV